MDGLEGAHFFREQHVWKKYHVLVTRTEAPLIFVGRMEERNWSEKALIAEKLVVCFEGMVVMNLFGG